MIQEILAIITLITLLGCLITLTIFAIKEEQKKTDYKNTMYKAITKYVEEKNKENK